MWTVFAGLLQLNVNLDIYVLQPNCIKLKKFYLLSGFRTSVWGLCLAEQCLQSHLRKPITVPWLHQEALSLQNHWDIIQTDAANTLCFLKSLNLNILHLMCKFEVSHSWKKSMQLLFQDLKKEMHEDHIYVNIISQFWKLNVFTLIYLKNVCHVILSVF